jgi:hypothetical protein
LNSAPKSFGDSGFSFDTTEDYRGEHIVRVTIEQRSFVLGCIAELWVSTAVEVMIAEFVHVLDIVEVGVGSTGRKKDFVNCEIHTIVNTETAAS